MKIGILQNSLGQDHLDKVFQRARDAQADGIELRFTSDEVPQIGAVETADQYRELAERYSLAIPSLNLAFLCHEPSLLGSEEVIARAQELIRQSIVLAAELGAHKVLLPFFHNSALELDEEISSAADALAEVVGDAEDADVQLGLESDLSFNRQRYLLDLLGSGNVGIYHDTGNATARRLDLPSGIRDLGADGTAGIHFRDVRVGENVPPDFSVALGEGNVDFRAVVQSLRAIGYDDWVVLETPPGDDPLATAAANVEFTREQVSRA